MFLPHMALPLFYPVPVPPRATNITAVAGDSMRASPEIPSTVLREKLIK
jgi:hypothetical protein